jgi:hypothetical protein
MNLAGTFKHGGYSLQMSLKRICFQGKENLISLIQQKKKVQQPQSLKSKSKSAVESGTHHLLLVLGFLPLFSHSSLPVTSRSLPIPLTPDDIKILSHFILYW